MEDKIERFLVALETIARAMENRTVAVQTLCDVLPEHVAHVSADPPVETVEPPVETVEPPVETVEPPVETVESEAPRRGRKPGRKNKPKEMPPETPDGALVEMAPVETWDNTPPVEEAPEAKPPTLEEMNKMLQALATRDGMAAARALFASHAGGKAKLTEMEPGNVANLAQALKEILDGTN